MFNTPPRPCPSLRSPAALSFARPQPHRRFCFRCPFSWCCITNPKVGRTGSQARVERAYRPVVVVAQSSRFSNVSLCRLPTKRQSPLSGRVVGPGLCCWEITHCSISNLARHWTVFPEADTGFVRCNRLQCAQRRHSETLVQPSWEQPAAGWHRRQASCRAVHQYLNPHSKSSCALLMRLNSTPSMTPRAPQYCSRHLAPIS